MGFKITAFVSGYDSVLILPIYLPALIRIAWSSVFGFPSLTVCLIINWHYWHYYWLHLLSKHQSELSLLHFDGTVA